MAGKVSCRHILKGKGAFDGTNFSDWEMNIRIALAHEKLLYTIDHECPSEPSKDDTVAWLAWSKHHNDSIEAQCLMLSAMTPKYRRQNKGYTPGQIMARLKDLNDPNLLTERLEISKLLFRSQMTEGTSVEKHVTNMIAYIDRLATLGFVIDIELKTDLILQSLPHSWDNFIVNYNMLYEETTLEELVQMLKEAEPELNKRRKNESHLTKAFKKVKENEEAKKSPFKPFGGIQKGNGASSFGKVMTDQSQDVCLYCGKRGHWKRDCQKYKTDLNNKKQDKPVTSETSDENED